MEIAIHAFDPHRNGQPVEVVERKGIGHPDTICDALAEQICVALCQYYLDQFGVILHHNVDKILLCGGAARPAFSGGEVSEPIELYLAGRVTTEYEERRVPVSDIAVEACRQWFRRYMPALDVDHHIKIVPRFRSGSRALTSLFGRVESSGPPCNDTSCGAGFAPLTPLENAVFEIERTLNNPSTKQSYPAIGQDIKVMGVRHGSRTHFTVACAMIDSHLHGVAEYTEAKANVHKLALDAARRYLDGAVDVVVNAADDITNGNVYLTVTGTSAESGDDGEVGRGNRASGLITPYRPMTLEAAAGKNPVSHVGKLYNLAAIALANRACELPQVRSATCVMVSQIGRAVEDPDIVDLGVYLDSGYDLASLTPVLEDLVRSEFLKFPQLQAALLTQSVGIY